MSKYDKAKIVSDFVASADSCLLPSRIEKLWGQPHRVRPAYCAKPIGDGKLLLLITPYYDRPAYYLIYGDSSWLDKETKRLVEDFIYISEDSITNTLEEEFGHAHSLDDNGQEIECVWPTANFDYGYEFCLGDELEDFFTEYQFSKMKK